MLEQEFSWSICYLISRPYLVTPRVCLPVNSLFGRTVASDQPLPLPQFTQRYGEYALVGQREPVVTGVEQYPRLEILAAAISQPHKPLPVFGVECTGGFDLNTPSLLASSKDYIDFHLILVAIVPETQIRFCPGGLGYELLYHERTPIDAPCGPDD